jgi:hypothetical protein
MLCAIMEGKRIGYGVADEADVPKRPQDTTKREFGRNCPLHKTLSLIRCSYPEMGIGFCHFSQSLSKGKFSITAWVTLRMIPRLVVMIFAAKATAFLLTVVALLATGRTSSKTSSLRVSNKKKEITVALGGGKSVE